MLRNSSTPMYKQQESWWQRMHYKHKLNSSTKLTCMYLCTPHHNSSHPCTQLLNSMYFSFTPFAEMHLAKCAANVVRKPLSPRRRGQAKANHCSYDIIAISWASYCVSIITTVPHSSDNHIGKIEHYWIREELWVENKAQHRWSTQVGE